MICNLNLLALLLFINQYILEDLQLIMFNKLHISINNL